MNIVFVDVLDFYALPKILKYADSRKVYYMSGSGKVSKFFVSKLLKCLGYTVRELESCFEVEADTTCHINLNANILKFLDKNVSQRLRKEVESFDGNLPVYSIEKLTNFLLIRVKFAIKREFELLDSIKNVNQIDGLSKVVLLHESISSSSLKRYLDVDEIKFFTYCAPLRKTILKRDFYHNDRLYQVKSFLNSSLEFLKFFKTVLMVCFHKIKFKIVKRNSKSKNLSRFDFLSVLHTSNDRDYASNELYWLDPLKKMRNVKVLGFCPDVIKNEAFDFYNNFADEIISGDSAAKYIILKTYLQSVFSSFFKVISGVILRNITYSNASDLIRVIERKCFFDSIFLKTGIRYLWNDRESNDFLPTGLSLAVKNVGGVSFGTTWSAHYFPSLFLRYTRNDILFLSGRRQVEIIKKSGALVKRYVLTGYQTAKFSNINKNDKEDKHPILNILNRNKKIITCYDNVVLKDIVMRVDEAKLFYQSLFDWVNNNEVLFVLKAKNLNFKYLDKSSSALFNDLVKQDKIIVNNRHADLKSGLMADIVVGISATSLLLFAAAYGKQTICFDRHNILTTYPPNLKNLTIIKDPLEISEQLDIKLSKSDKSFKQKQGGNVDAFADMGADDRAASYVNYIMTAMDNGKTSYDAILSADEKYIKEWGDDKIIDPRVI